MYVISDGEYVKIGVATEVVKRLGILQVGNPRLLRLAYFKSMEGPFEVERAAHVALKAKHVRGEWFCATEEEAIAVVEASL